VLLAALREDGDPVIRTLARATPDQEWTEWHARDMWPSRSPFRGNVVLVGDAAHPMLPTVGQGACQALEDAAVLAGAVAAERDLDRALRRYAVRRARRVRPIVAMARAGAVSRRSTAAGRVLPATVTTRLAALSGGPALRRLTRPAIAWPG
jgi:2-polyprenyl-6-methoxyphenol hydroxylase-like FAD-dependent oxidoreductase